MIFDLDTADGRLDAKHKLAHYDALGGTIEIKVVKNQRTNKQNSSAHLWFQHIADTFNDKGLDMQATLAKRVGLRWTPEAVKECLFKVLGNFQRLPICLRM